MIGYGTYLIVNQLQICRLPDFDIGSSNRVRSSLVEMTTCDKSVMLEESAETQPIQYVWSRLCRRLMSAVSIPWTLVLVQGAVLSPIAISDCNR